MKLEENVKDFGMKYFGMADERQGIVHIIGPEQVSISASLAMVKIQWIIHLTG